MKLIQLLYFIFFSKYIKINLNFFFIINFFSYSQIMQKDLIRGEHNYQFDFPLT